MHPRSRIAVSIGLLAVGATFFGSALLAAQERSYSSTSTTTATTQAAVAQPPGKENLVRMFSAILVDPEALARQKAVTVEVKVDGIELKDPQEVSPSAARPQAQLLYQLDQGPGIATKANRMTFLDLPPGEHSITIRLAGQDHKPLGPYQLSTVRIPE